MHKISAKFLTADIRPEAQLLLCCARTRIDSGTAKRIKTLVHKHLDWAYLIRTARRHRVVPLLYWSLKTACSEAVPKATLDQLRDHFHANARRNLFATGKLLKLLTLLKADGIPAISLKGPILAASAYGNLALRQFDDLDILVHRQDVLKAKDLLISQGYRLVVPQIKLGGAQEAYYLKSYHDYSFVRDGDRAMVELQWRFIERYFSFPLDPKRSWEHLEPVSLAGRMVLNLSPEDLLLILCVHGSKHGWEQLHFICDVAELIRAHPGMDWEQVTKQAGSLGGERMLFLGLFLAHNLLGAALPEAVLPRVQADPVVKSLAAQVGDQLFREPHYMPGVLKRCFFHLKARERLRDRVRYCLRLAMIPTLEDWAFLSLPAFLSFLYYLLRPIRLVRKCGLSLLKPRQQFSY